MATFIFENYCNQAVLNLKGNRVKSPSIEQIWKEAMRIAWPEPEIEAKFALPGPDPDLPEEDGPFWVTVNGQDWLIWVVDGVLVFKECAKEGLAFKRDDPDCNDFLEMMTRKFGEPEPDYTGPKPL